MNLVTSGLLRQHLEDVLQLWAPWYLAEAGRSEVAGGLEPLHPPLDDPREWRLALGAAGQPSHRQLPLVVITVGQWQPERHPDVIDAVFEVAVNVILRGASWEDTARRCGLYGAAFAAALEQQVPAGPLVEELMVRRIDYDLTPEAGRTIGEVVIGASAAVAGVIDPAFRTATTPPAGRAAVPDLHAETVNVTADRLDP